MKFLKASFQGWIYCRDHQAECVEHRAEERLALGRGHQTWQMNEINALIWPNPRGIGLLPTGGRRADREDREDLRRDQEGARRARPNYDLRGEGASRSSRRQGSNVTGATLEEG